ncbi:Cysteine-rich receptor-like protein kinase 42 [Vitis vinifera]|uniref:Cysteine-rich receptor-like protein kinase 42 n=1 Tax=Vitis vinifera TaxID=29760 RepID=A0A438EG69_VITVI|nr:Cysteine-rich receptor-like protein kinase 42 [Vitis vinifera]
MPSSIKVHSKPTWLISFFILFSLSSSDPRTSEAGLYCSPAKSTDKNFVPVFVKEMEFLSQLVTLNLWGSHFVNSTPPMYGLAQCHQDLSHLDCLLCYAAGRTKLPRCLPATSARIYLDGCFLRYDNYSFFSESVDPDHDAVNCSSGSGAIVDQGAKLEFVKNVHRVINNVTATAVANGGYGVAVVEGGAVGVYALAECWKTVNSSGCRACLQKASNEVRGCLPGKEGRGLNAGCYLRYSTEKFYDNGGESEGGSGSSRTGLTIAIVLAAAALILVSLFAAYAGYASLSKIKEERKNLGKVSSIINKSSLNFKYETLERATEYFNPSRKLGQGGAGSVYMGTLPNGEIVAVKRLIFNTRQWVDEFFNEVNLISGIQHKNLVKLLGCSIEGPESLLVYEYVPNRSLDQFMFDKNKIQTLNWEQRFDIIVGTAEGLAYLHGGLQMRIIHRDIKGSNILLDENLTPKIADFGLARCLGADKTHLSTGIAGTLGYMAPEYLVRGQLTEKADVYSFGVLVLEIVCGRKNSVFTQDSGSLLQRVWKLYKSNKLVEAIDDCLKDDFPEKEASDVLRIGLLCTQASVALRPSMTEVVWMLTHKDWEIPPPNQPPFLNAHVLESAISRSNSANTSMSNMATKIEVSGPFTESSSMHSSMDHQEEQKLMQ